MSHALDLELIKTFLTVVETQGFKPAAEQLHRTPAAISQQIKRLEDILGKRVLDRSNQGISLTSAGAMLKSHGEQLMSLNYRLLSDFRENELAGQLRFGAPTDYAPTLLQKLLPIFQREFPRVSPALVLEPSRSLRTKVQAGTLDLAIVGCEPGKVEGHPLWTEEVAWFGTSPRGTVPHRVGVLTTDCVLRDQALRDLKARATPYDLVLEAATVASLRDAVEADFCCAFLPVSIAAPFARAPVSASRAAFHLTFSLISGPGFDTKAAARAAERFGAALER